MAWTTPTTAAGQVLTNSIWNASVRDDLLYLKDRVDNPTRAHVTNSGALSIANNTPTIATWDTEAVDSNAVHSTSANTGRMTIPTGEGGWYAVAAYIDWAANATGVRQIYLRLNGTGVIANVIDNAVAGGSTTPQVVVALWPLVATDYVEVIVSQTSGGSLNVNTGSRFEIIRVA